MPMSAIVPIGTVTVGMPRCADRQVAVGHPDAVAPAEVGRGLVDVHVGGADVGDGGEDDGVQAQPVHPLLEVDAPRLLEPAQPLLQMRDVEERSIG